jgi:hypothetical protein
VLLKVKIGDEKVIELSRDIKHFMQCLNLILDYLMTVSIKKQILILILAAFSLNGACGMLDPKVDAAVKGLSPLNWPLTVNDLELWNKENLVVAKNEKELLAHYMRYYHAKSSSLKNEFYDGFLSRFWGYFVSCVASNPFHKQEISQLTGSRSCAPSRRRRRCTMLPLIKACEMTVSNGVVFNIPQQ